MCFYNTSGIHKLQNPVINEKKLWSGVIDDVKSILLPLSYF